MNITTIFIAQIAGPILLALGFGFFTSKNYYAQVYRNLERETLAVLMGAITSFIIGILIILNHNIWTDFPSVVISLLGWLSLAKGIMLAVFPRFVEKIGNKIAATQSWFVIWGILAIVLGGYFMILGYFL